ncbi:integral membrane protein [Arthrobacter crystallopoietes BAB-32]|uniref:Integral membrane protein n=1 Tax=Arthrobacter crystallopoietes BAB-32 TaxID=1246476 RepID=N1UWC1_9MICC|nr:DUF3159 domain-containing protein [Arthrobacter crystallopoietes]EMY33350.1 integral membrane protein [Arthrobacter crystallopoietes BAB-32]
MTEKPAPRDEPEKPFAELAGAYAAKAGMERRDDGQIDVLKSIGGVRGLVESVLPGIIFLVVFTIGRELGPALIGALGAAAAFTVLRLIQRGTVTQAFSGLVGVGICAFVANSTGRAEDFYVWGFVTNAAYIVGMVLSILIKWPLAGLLFGFIRGENVEWRKEPRRLKAYVLATWIVTAVLVLRLVVQVPLYLMGEDGLVALGTARLVMGLPLYALGIWLAWLVSRPVGGAVAGSGTGRSGQEH